MQLPPPEVTSQWPPPNYVNPIVRGPGFIITGVLLSSVATAVVGLRIFTRLIISKCYGIDDVLITIACLSAIGHIAIIGISDLRFGGDRHIWDVPLEDFVIARKLNFALIILFAISCTITKISMLFFTRRILSGASKLYRLGITAAILIVVAEGVIFCFIVVFQCRPIDQYWALTGTTNCIDENSNLLASSIINTLTDFIVVLMPIPTLWDLHLPTKQRLQVISLFAVGFIACSAGIGRTIYTYKFTSTWDKTWEACPVWISSTVELDLGIICASLPAVKPLLARFLPSKSEYSSTRTGASMPRHPTLNESFYLKELAARPRVTETCDDEEDNESQRRIFPNPSVAL